MFSYSFFLVLAGIVVCGGIIVSAWKSGESVKKTIVTTVLALIGAVLGARILQLATGDGLTLETILSPDFQHFSLYGGLLGGGLTGYVSTRALKLPVSKISNIAFIWSGVGIAIIRVGCFLEGCCYGRITDLPWGVHPHLYSDAHWDQLGQGQATAVSTQTIHPTQIYELISALIASGIAFLLYRKNPQSTVPTQVWIVVFTILRFITHFFRATFHSYSAPDWLYPISYSIIILVVMMKFNKNQLFVKLQ